MNLSTIALTVGLVAAAGFMGYNVIQKNQPAAPITIEATGEYVLYGAEWCPYCVSVEKTFEANDMDYEFRDVEDYQDFFAQNHWEGIPQVFDGQGYHIGGWGEVMEQLDALGYEIVMPVGE